MCLSVCVKCVSVQNFIQNQSIDPNAKTQCLSLSLSMCMFKQDTGNGAEDSMFCVFLSLIRVFKKHDILVRSSSNLCFES